MLALRLGSAAKHSPFRIEVVVAGIFLPARGAIGRFARRRSVSVVAVVALTLAVAGLGAAPASAADAASAPGGAMRVWHHATASADNALTAAVAKGRVPVIAQLDEPSLPTAASAAGFQARTQAMASVGARLAAALPQGSYSHVESLGSQPMVALTVDAKGLAALRAQPNVVRVTRNKFDKVSVTYQPNISRVGAPTAWAKGKTGAGETVAIIDTGVDKTNAYLTGKVVAEGCFTSQLDDGAGGMTTPICPGGDPTTSTATDSGLPCPVLAAGCFHGTHVAGIVAGGNGGAFSGVAPGATLISVDVFSEDTNTSAGCSPTPCIGAWDSDQIRALDYVFSLRNSFHIASVNMSLGGAVVTDADAHCDSEPQKPAIDELRSVGIATAIASGNSGAADVSSPGCISSAIAVGSVNPSTDVMSGFSNWSPALSLFAPGEGVLSSVPAGTPGTLGFTVSPCPAPYDASPCAQLDGTSMATPHVAGALAVLRQAKPGMAVSLEIDQLQGTGVPRAAEDGFYFSSLREGNAVTQMRPANFGGGVTSNLDGRLEVFRGTASGIQHKWQTTPNGRWSAWGSLGGPIHGAPVAVTDYDGRIEVFGTGSNHALYHAWQTKPGGPWSGWASLGGSITSGHFSIVMNWDGRLEIFTANSAGQVQHMWQTTPGGQWSGWGNLGLQVAGLRGLTTIRTSGGWTQLVVISTTGLEWTDVQVTPGGSWSGWWTLNSADEHTPSPAMIGNPIVGNDQDGRYEVFSADASNRLWSSAEAFSQGEYNAVHLAVNGGFTSGNLTVGRNVSLPRHRVAH